MHTYLGMNYHYQDLIGQALDEFDVACKLDPKNRMNKYQKVLLLMSMNKPERDQDALDLLLQMNKDGGLTSTCGCVPAQNHTNPKR